MNQLTKDVLNRIQENANEKYTGVVVAAVRGALIAGYKDGAKAEAARSAALLDALERIVGEIETNEYAPMVIIAACKAKAQIAIHNYKTN